MKDAIATHTEGGQHNKGKNMGEFTLINRSGEEHVLFGQAGIPLMEIIRGAGHEELVAMCGGCMSCATCHVFIEELPEGATLPEMSRDEDDMLDFSDSRSEGSRLSCQVPWSDELSGLRIRIAPEE